MQFLKTPNFDFLGKAPIFMAVSGVLMLASVILVVRPRGLHYGVEFSGGTQLILKFQNSPEIDKIRNAVEKQTPGAATIQTYDRPETNQVLVRIGTTGDTTGDGDLAAHADAVLQSIGSAYSENPIVEHSRDIVGPVVGAELRRKAVLLTLFGLVFQLIYIAWRFKGPMWGGAATLAVFHDVLITLGLLSVFKFEITLNVIAALLTLVGYSVNDTIVLFDRVRENLRQRRKDPLPKIINDSINQTLSRTLISNGTTFLTVLGLFIFGGEVLRGFGFTMVAGILVGTYSSIYIASPIVIWWQGLSANGGGASGKGGQGASVKAAL
jgi:preprotein translocase subunit SecF